MKKNSTYKVVLLLSLFAFWVPSSGYAQDNVIDMGEDTITSKVPKPPTDLEKIGLAGNLDKAIELKLEESFIIKITESMKKDPF